MIVSPGELQALTWYHMVFRVNRASATLNVGFVQDGTIINNKSQTVTTTFDTTGDFLYGKECWFFWF